MTRQNAANSEQTAANSKEMQSMAQQMDDQVRDLVGLVFGHNGSSQDMGF